MIIKGNYILDKDLTLNEELIIEATGQLIFDPTKTVKLSISKKITNQGLIVMRPANNNIHHAIERTYTDTIDVGLSVTGSGKLDVQGAPPVVPSQPLSAKFQSSVTIDNAKAGSKYTITAYSSKTIYKSGVLIAGTNVIDVSGITADNLYIRIDGKLLTKIVK